MKKILTVAVLALVLASGVWATRAQAAPLDLSGWAWSSNTGWLSFSSANANSAGVVPNGPLGQYGFDNSSAVDSGFNGNNGTVNGGAGFVTGKIGSKAISLDGVNDYVSLPASATLITPTRITLAAWIKPNVVNVEQRIINYHKRYRLELSPTGKLYCAFSTVNQSWNFCSTMGTTSLNPNTWYHVAVTYDGTTYTYYLNGVANGSNSTQFAGDLTNGQFMPCIGDGCDALGGKFFNGLVDDAILYSRALTPSEIQQLYTVGNAALYGVQFSTTTSQTVGTLSGYAWSSNVGWLSFNPSNVVGCPSSEANFDKPVSLGGVGADLPSGVTNICTPRVDLVSGKVSGWARVLSMATEDATTGWLHLSGTNHPTGTSGVKYDPQSGAFSGFAYEPSAIGWLDFTVGLPTGRGVSICVTGTPNCPPNPVPLGNCSIGTITMSGADVLIPVTLPGSGTFYSLNRGSNEVDRTKTPSDTIVDYAVPPGTYTYQMVKSSTPSVPCGAPKTFTVSPPQASSGLRLMIASPSTSLQADNYDDTCASSLVMCRKELTVVVGGQFKLQSNIDPAMSAQGYTDFAGRAIELGAPTVDWSGLTTGTLIKNNINTVGVTPGTYTYKITALGVDSVGTPLPSKTSTVKLKVVNTVLEEI
jgi:hypothetical protein